jgi:hypothetical protein
VNCGPRSYFLYIAITYLLYSHCLLYSHTITIFHSVRSFLCLQQTGEIDNLIVSWEQSIWLCCVQVPRCRSQSKAGTRCPINCPELSQASGHHLQSYWLLPLLINIPWFLNWGKTLLLYSSYLPLGVPNWMVKRYQHRTASVIKYVLVCLHTMYVCLCLSLFCILLYLTWLLWEFNGLSQFGGVICLCACYYPKNVCTWGRPLRIDIARLSSFYVICLAHEKFKLYNVH